MVEVRLALEADEQALVAIDRATWSADTTPSPPAPPDRPFFNDRTSAQDVLVAEVNLVVAGYVKLGRATPLPASDHVIAINGLAVDPAHQRRGIGRALLDAAGREAASRGARRLTLRVLGPNTPARRLYESQGFVVEGVLCGEFLIDGRYVDDVLMALELS